MENLKIVLAGLKLGLEHVIVARVYITDFEANYPRMNAVYAELLPGRPPAGADLHRRHRPRARRDGRDRPAGQALIASHRGAGTRKAPAQAAAATSNRPGTTENAKARLPPVKASTIFVTVLVVSAASTG